MAGQMTTTQAAAALGISRIRVVQLITAGRLPAEKVGRDWLITPQALDLVRERKTGWPKGRKRGKKKMATS